MLIAAAVLIVSSVVLSSAQPSPECITAFNATFASAGTNCSTAYGWLFYGNATDEQRMMVCDADQQCNTMIENIISACSNTTIEYPTRFGQDLLCTTGPNGTNCLTAFSKVEYDIFDMIDGSCFSNCTSSCMQTLMLLNNTLGCCFAEIFNAQVDNGIITRNHASLFTNNYPDACGVETFTFCNGSAVPRSPCSNAITNLYAATDDCSRAIQALLSGNGSALLDLYSGNCPTQFQEFVTPCSDVFGDELVQLANGILATSQATSSSGRPCSEFALLLAIDDEFEATCSRDVFLKQCSSDCREAITNITADYGCCFNTFVAEFYGRSIDSVDQIEYRILTDDVYSLCGVTSAGFCNLTNPAPSYTDASDYCISARDKFFADDTCLDYYRALGLLSSPTEVNNAANALCASQTCVNRVTSYIDYLLTCRVGSILDDDDDDDDEDEERSLDLELAALIGTTTCRVNTNGDSCYSSIAFNSMYDQVEAAFDTDNPDAVCASTITELTCSLECSQFLRTVMNNVGCCLNEYAIASSGIYTSEAVFQLCNIPSLIDNRCSGFGFPITNSLCGAAYIYLFTINDECSRAARGLIMGNKSAIYGLFNGDCPTRLYNYTTACNGGGEIDELLQVANSILTITEARNSNGTTCSDVFEALLIAGDNDDFERRCNLDYLSRQCSDTCRQGLQYLTTQYGCCYNTIIGAFANLSSEQIEYAISTRDIYDLCGVSSGGFCAGFTVPPYTNAAEQCISVGDTFFADDTCLEYYRALSLRSSVTAVNDAANALCASQMCMDRMDSYISYLVTCRVGSIADEDDDDDDDDDNDDDDDLEFAYVIGNTTCKIDTNGNSCYSSIYSNPLYAEVAAAFDVNDLATAICIPAVTQPTCPSACSQLLMRVANSIGCCFIEWARATADPDALQIVATSCGISLDNRCSEIQISTGGGVTNMQKGLGVLIVLLIGIMAIVLS